MRLVQRMHIPPPMFWTSTDDLYNMLIRKLMQRSLHSMGPELQFNHRVRAPGHLESGKSTISFGGGALK